MNMSTFIMNLGSKPSDPDLILLHFVSIPWSFFIFAAPLFRTQSIGLTPYQNPYTETVDFEKAVYSALSPFIPSVLDIHRFHAGRRIVMLQSVISMFFTRYSPFPGFLHHQKPNDIFTTKNCTSFSEWYTASIRIGNKGRTIIDWRARFGAWNWEQYR